MNMLFIFSTLSNVDVWCFNLFLNWVDYLPSYFSRTRLNFNLYPNNKTKTFCCTFIVSSKDIALTLLSSSWPAQRVNIWFILTKPIETFLKFCKWLEYYMRHTEKIYLFFSNMKMNTNMLTGMEFIYFCKTNDSNKSYFFRSLWDHTRFGWKITT